MSLATGIRGARRSTRRLFFPQPRIIREECSRRHERLLPWTRSTQRGLFARLGSRQVGKRKSRLPKFCGASAVFTNGPVGRAISTEALRSALAELYALRGSGEKCAPTEAKLAELGVSVRPWKRPGVGKGASQCHT